MFKKQNLISLIVLILGLFLIFGAAYAANTFPTTLNDWDDGDVIESDWADALEAKIGVDSSTVTTSLTYQFDHIYATTTLSSLATIGTITTGVWNGTVIGDAYITKTGDWTGTFDGQEGSHYLNANNLIDFGAPFYTYFNATNTDALSEGSTNLYSTQTNWDTFWNASTTLSSVTSVPNLTTLGSGTGFIYTSSGSITASTTIGDSYFSKTGDWTGLFDGQEGSHYLDANNLTDFGAPFYTYFNATTTDYLTEGSTNFYADQARWDTFWNASTTLTSITTLSNLATVGTLAAGTLALDSLSFSGTLDHEYGGLEADVSSYAGLVSITGGSTAEVNSIAELNALLSGESVASTTGNSSIVTVGALDSGSITSGFTSIDTGAGAITTTGTITAGTLTVGDDSFTDLVAATTTLDYWFNNSAGLTGNSNIATLAGLTAIGASGATTTNSGGEVITTGFRLANYVNCDTLDTDGSGYIKCGSDAAGATGPMTDLEDVTLTSTTTNDILQITSSGGDFVNISFGNPFYTYFNATNTDALSEGSTNFWADQDRWDTFWAASTTLASVTTLSNAVTVGALNSGSIASGFGNIDNGSSNFDCDGTITSTGTIDFGGATSAEIPNAASPTVDAAGEIAIDTTSGQLKWYDGSKIQLVTGTTSPAFNIASTTLDGAGKSMNIGTTTLHLKNPPEAITLMGFYCKATTTGTVAVAFGDGADNWTPIKDCTSTGTFHHTSSNNTWTAFEDFRVQASSTAGTVDRVTITTLIKKTAD